MSTISLGVMRDAVPMNLSGYRDASEASSWVVFVSRAASEQHMSKVEILI